MDRIEVKSAYRRGRVTRVSRNRRLRPTVMALEGRALLSTFTVSSTADDGSAGTLRWAIGQANGNQGADTIVFSSLFNTPQTITLTGGPLGLTDTATTTITGHGANLLTVNGNKASRVFDVASGSAAVLSGLTIAGGSADNGGGLLNSGGTLTLTNATVSGNSATVQGGGLASRFGGETTLDNVTVNDNTAPAGAGLFNSYSTLSLTNCTVSANTASSQGGGLLNSGNTATLTNSTISGNTAGTNGGGLFNYHAGEITLTNSTISGNTATVQGGGLYNAEYSRTTLTNTVVAGQTKGGDVSGSYTDGGHNLIGGNPLLGALGDYGGPTFTMALLPGSPAIGGGAAGAGIPTTDQRGQPRGARVDIGAFESQGTALVVNTTAGGVGSASGQLSLPQAVNLANVLATADSISFASSTFASPQTITLTAGPLVLTDTATTTITGPGAYLLSISGNNAGEVFDIKGGSAALSALTITGGGADNGGGLRNEGGTVSLTNCTVSGNAATVQGGGLYNFDGTLSLFGCTVSSNTAPTGAGLAGSGGTLTTANATFSQNTASGQGGGLYLRLGTAALTNCTISANSAATGGGLVNSGNTATVTLTNTIIAGQSSGGDVTGNYTGSNNVIGVNPLLGLLFDYGGPTRTMPPLPGSPAIGRGTSGPGIPTTDQRGFARGASVDIGAFQTEGAASMEVNVTTDGLGSGLGQLDLRQAIDLANIEPGTNTVSFSPSVFGTKLQTITLTAGQMGLGDVGSPVVDGPGASLLTINGNNASRVFVLYGTSAALSGLTITGGNATKGGGLYENGGTLTLTDCTVSGNSASIFGGGLSDNYGTLTLTDCTVSGNSASIVGGGGGVNINGGTASLTNVTISGNSAASGGGGLGDYGTVTLINVTVGGNIGVGLFNVSTGPLSMTNTIIDNYVGNNFTGSNNLINVNPLLSSLGDYGGPTATMALLPGSPAISGGTATGAPAFDQRGEARAGHVDIGAFQSKGFNLTPVAGSTPQSAVAGNPFVNSLAVAVTPNNPHEPVNGGVVSFAITPVDRASATLSAATATIKGGEASVKATANATNGTYVVSATTTGAEPEGFVLTNTEAPSLTVTTKLDVVNDVDGLTSLREAIAYANSHPGPETIILDPAVFGKSRHTITLTGGPLVLTDPATITIIGPGANLLTLSGGRKSRVFDIEGGSLALEGMTITGGRADRGGGILNDGGRLALDRVVLRGNRARVGGGLYNEGTAALTDVTIRGNTARVGSGLFSARRATLTWQRSPAGSRGGTRVSLVSREKRS
jgi:hypothetical protein